MRLAVKQVPITATASEVDVQVDRLLDEVALLKRISHRHIIRYLGGRRDLQHRCLYMFMELVSAGSLSQLIRNYGPLPEPLIVNYTRQVVAGLHHLHENGIVHRDIKSSNILITTDGVVKVADFGAARQLQDACWTGTRSICGTAAWMAPEVVRLATWSPMSDIWSLGCVLIEMGSGHRPWPGLGQYEILWRLSHSDDGPQIPDSISLMGRMFIRQCLQIDPDHRPDTTQLLQHPFQNQPT